METVSFVVMPSNEKAYAYSEPVHALSVVWKS